MGFRKSNKERPWATGLLLPPFLKGKEAITWPQRKSPDSSWAVARRTELVPYDLPGRGSGKGQLHCGTLFSCLWFPMGGAPPAAWSLWCCTPGLALQPPEEGGERGNISQKSNGRHPTCERNSKQTIKHGLITESAGQVGQSHGLVHKLGSRVYDLLNMLCQGAYPCYCLLHGKEGYMGRDNVWTQTFSFFTSFFFFLFCICLLLASGGDMGSFQEKWERTPHRRKAGLVPWLSCAVGHTSARFVLRSLHF